MMRRRLTHAAAPESGAAANRFGSWKLPMLASAGVLGHRKPRADNPALFVRKASSENSAMLVLAHTAAAP